MSALWARYLRTLAAHPFRTQSCTSMTTFGLADLAAQQIDPPPRFDGARTLRMMVYGGFVFAPIARTWFLFIDKLIPGISFLLHNFYVLIHGFLYHSN
jgi:protein Mpv17